jgi:transposase-like protein
MDEQIRKRLRWVKLYEEVKNAGVVCRRCGISRPSLRKWLKRYANQKSEGLLEQSRRPKRSPARKVNEQLKDRILELRGRRLGARRIRNELQRLFSQSLSLATIHKVLVSAGAKPLVRIRRKEQYKIYSRPVPGDRIQMDTCKIGPGLCQYTAIDDCTRYRVLALSIKGALAQILCFS